ncbi:hypothetical protein [Photobacterium phosphoreum]|uniref:hypothetical protein n=1 Tax=Photobacterium phosphoreum TaxID=659 RepID=UPI001E3CFCB7|nr:hypothetical protein [Photobacterium phosphoreum]MCD9476596.1 hypothetical protein [Photobacterium phosphoreum]MCF2177265.1 hypothetical protein [Photobacterium phosphoreum]
MNTSNCERIIQDINSLISHIINDREEFFFESSNLIKPDFKNQELSFVRLVSWLYTLYFETGKVGLNIVKPSLDEKSRSILIEHTKLIHAYRTKLQHNLDRAKDSRNFKLESVCLKWSKKVCGVNVPRDETEWSQCSIFLIDETEAVLNSIYSMLDDMTNTDSKSDDFISNWRLTKTRNIEPYVYDLYIKKFLSFTSPDEFDIVKFRSKHLDKWRRHINILDSSADLYNEIGKIVESTMVSEFIHVLPITIKEMEKEFYLSKSIIDELYCYMAVENNTKNIDSKLMMERLRDRFPELVRE